METSSKQSASEDKRARLPPAAFILRRLHSLFGVWLVVYLAEHLFVNSQAGLFFLDGKTRFINLVNQINALPYLRLVEIVLLGVPFVIHGVWGILYAWQSKLNAHGTDGTKPALPQYRRNRAFSWQRITAWLLLIGIFAHVLQMRFLAYPAHISQGNEQKYIVRLQSDQGMASLAEKLHVIIYRSTDSESPEVNAWLKGLQKNEVAALAPNIGTAFFLIVRETFKSPLMVVLYSFLVIGTVFHAFNGVWTFMITWGLTLTPQAQRRSRFVTTCLMGIVMLLGLIAIWGTCLGTQLQR